MGNNFCSLCNKQTTITEINQLSVNLINNKNDNQVNNNIINSSISNINESFSSINDLSLNQEINFSKQSLYQFNKLIYLIDKKTKNILLNHMKRNDKIKEEIKDLCFINNYQDYKKIKRYGVYTIKGMNFDNLGIPKEIYIDKGLNYIKRNKYIEVLFIKDMKIVKILNDNNVNVHSIHKINSLNHIESFSTKINKLNIQEKGTDIKYNTITNYSSIVKKETNENLVPFSSRININSDLLDFFSLTNVNDISREIESSRLSQGGLIFQTLLCIAEEENSIINSLESKIDIKNVREYYLINNYFLNRYKSLFCYKEIYDLYAEKNIKKEIKEKLIKNDLIKDQQKILEKINSNLNMKKDFFESIEIKELRFLIKNEKYKSKDGFKKIEIPYNFSIINKISLDLIIKQFNYKCLNSSKDKKCQGKCEFCRSNFLNKYKCYIGNETLFIDYRENNINSHYFLCIFDTKNFDKNKILDIKTDYLFLFENDEIFINEIDNYMNTSKELNDYFKLKNLGKNSIFQNITDIDSKTKIGEIINIKLLLNKKEESETNFFPRKSKTLKNFYFDNRRKIYSPRKSPMKKISTKTNPLLTYTKPSLIGLNKSGQPFFFNPILQCFSNISNLTNFYLSNYNFFVENNKEVEYPFSYHYSNLINELWKKPSEEDSEINNYPYYKKSFLPLQLKNYLFNLNNSILCQQKNMFRELFLFILKLMDDELNKYEKEKMNNTLNNTNKSIIINNLNKTNKSEVSSENKSLNKSEESSESSSSSSSSSLESEEKLLKKFREDYHQKYNSIIAKNFYCEIQISYQCLECNLYKYHYEIINSFTFDLEKIKNNIILKYKFRDIMKKILVISLSDCFENQEKPSILEQNILCQKCNLKTLQKQTKIIKSPNILVLFFKEKEVSEVQFEIQLDLQLNSFVHDQIYENGEDDKDQILEFKRNSYDLICILCSLPYNSKKGNCLAYCKNPINNWWYSYNDSIVTNVDVQVLREIRIPKMLIYRRKEVICLIFMIGEGQKFNLEVNMDMVFRNVVSYLYVKYSWLKNLNIFNFVNNGKEVDINKTVSQNNLNNGSIIICKRNIYLKI